MHLTVVYGEEFNHWSAVGNGCRLDHLAPADKKLSLRAMIEGNVRGIELINDKTGERVAWAAKVVEY